MSEDNLRDLLARVHERLANAGPIDQDSRALLATVVRDIERTLNRGGEDAVARAAQSAPKLEAVAVQLETEHPGLAQVLRQFVDLLVKAGI
jgi:predicted component of type VI protein secretion system